MYTCEVTQRSIAFEIAHEDYTAIEKRDRDREDASDEAGNIWNYNEIYLSGILDHIEGVSDADYNGHFGSYVFFNLDAENDTPEKREEIKTLIVNYINGKGEFA